MKSVYRFGGLTFMGIGAKKLRDSYRRDFGLKRPIYRCGRIMNCPNPVERKGGRCTWCSLSMSA